jgi:hypothetical protein
MDRSTIRNSGVISMQSKDVYSLSPMLFTASDEMEEAPIIAQGQSRPSSGQMLLEEWIIYETRPLDYGHLEDPVPENVYFHVRDDFWGEQSHCATITDGS